MSRSSRTHLLIVLLIGAWGFAIWDAATRVQQGSSLWGEIISMTLLFAITVMFTRTLLPNTSLRASGRYTSPIRSIVPLIGVVVVILASAIGNLVWGVAAALVALLIFFVANLKG